ncbi:hypothetical protein V8N76_004503 [Salmonella enterica]
MLTPKERHYYERTSNQRAHQPARHRQEDDATRKETQRENTPEQLPQ